MASGDYYSGACNGHLVFEESLSDAIRQLRIELAGKVKLLRIVPRANYGGHDTVSGPLLPKFLPSPIVPDRCCFKLALYHFHWRNPRGPLRFILWLRSTYIALMPPVPPYPYERTPGRSSHVRTRKLVRIALPSLLPVSLTGKRVQNRRV